MFKTSVLLVITALISANSMATVPADLQNKVVGVRLDDMVNSYPQAILGLPNIAVLIKKNPSYFFQQSEIEDVRDVFFNQMPSESSTLTTLEVVAFVKYKKNVYTFEKMLISYSPGAKTLADLFVQSEAVYPLSEMNFRASVGLVDRKLIIEDEMKDIKLVFPIGVGSFDEGTMNEGRYSLLTPRFKNGYIDQREVISKRSKPRYFQGLPFIRISNGNEGHSEVTPIGFHIEINDSFVRGFDSHGCMRLREMDLMAFHDLIVFGSQQKIPLVIQYKLSDLADHPIGKRNKSYKAILNRGAPGNPFFILDRGNLVQLVYKENSPAPIEKLVDNAQDNYEDIFSYETNMQLKEQEARRTNECQAKVMSGQIASDPKTFQSCVDEGKRKDSWKDKLYRKYMGIDNVTSNLI